MEGNSITPHGVVRFEINPITTPVDSLGPDDLKPPGPLDDTKRKWLIERIALEIESNYVFPEIGEKMVAEVRQRLAKGDYDSKTTETNPRTLSPNISLASAMTFTCAFSTA